MDRHGRSSSRWGDWSEWAWNDQYQRYYRVRQDRDGELDYQWDTQSTPRTPDVDEVTDNMDRLRVTKSSSGDVPAEGHYTTSTSHPDSRRAQDERRSDKHRDKGKSKDTSHRRNERDRHGRDDFDDSGQRRVVRQDHSLAKYDYDDEDPRYSYRDYTQGGGEPSTSYEDAAYRADPRVAKSEYYADPALPQEYLQGSGRASASTDTYRSYDSQGYEAAGGYQKNAVPPSAAANAPSLEKSILLADELEQLDPRYRIMNSNFFLPGEIFKVYWAEPKGANTETASISDKHEVVDRFGGKFFIGFRRFVVVATEIGSSICVPILTYSGKACKKRGVKAEKHGIIYMRGHKPRLLEGEPNLGFPPVSCRMTEEGETITKQSRINYSKLVTVEHNVKVFFVGRLSDDDQVDLVNDAVNAAWNARKHDRKHDRRHDRH